MAEAATLPKRVKRFVSGIADCQVLDNKLNYQTVAAIPAAAAAAVAAPMPMQRWQRWSLKWHLLLILS